MALDSPQTNGSWGRPLWAEMDLDALAYNVASLKGQAGPAAMAAVVKANAYAILPAGFARLAIVSLPTESIRRHKILIGTR